MWPRAIHATAVAIDGRALLICGPSRAGKSHLALSLMATSKRGRPIALIGDDRILLTPTTAGLIARPHPRIAGFIERRGLGLVAMPYVESAPVAAVVVLGEISVIDDLDRQNFPVLQIVTSQVRNRRDEVLDWWDHAQTATCAQHLAGKAAGDGRAARKD